MIGVKKDTKVLKVKNNTREQITDQLITEYPFTIFINQKEIITLLCTPKSLKELTVGFIISESLIDSVEEIANINIMEEEGQAWVETNMSRPLRESLQGKRTITSGCGKGTTFYNVLDSFKSIKIQNNIGISAKLVLQLMKEFTDLAQLFKETGGVHSCSLSGEGKILYYEEDIGRHNALDKVLGSAHLDGIDFGDKMVLTTGRISSEILIKTAKRGIPAIISRSAPTSLAVELAEELGITLIGFARGDKMNIYSNFSSIDF